MQVSLDVLDKPIEEEIGILLDVLEPSKVQQWLLQDIQALARDFCSILGTPSSICDLQQIATNDLLVMSVKVGLVF